MFEINDSSFGQTNGYLKPLWLENLSREILGKTMFFTMVVRLVPAQFVGETKGNF